MGPARGTGFPESLVLPTKVGSSPATARRFSLAISPSRTSQLRVRKLSPSSSSPGPFREGAGLVDGDEGPKLCHCQWATGTWAFWRGRARA